MGRPKIGNEPVRVRMNLTLLPEVKEMADTIRIKKGISISALMEQTIRTEYKRIMKREEADEKPTV